MALNIYYDKDADLGRLEGKTVAVIGYGSQGHAHAQNLNNSGVSVIVGLRKGSASWDKAEVCGPEGGDHRARRPAKAADVVMMTVPDETRGPALRRRDRGPNLVPGNYLAVAHGFNIHFAAITPPDAGERLHGGAQGARATRCAPSTSRAAACPPWSPSTRTPPVTRSRSPWPMRRVSGAGRAGIVETTFRDETETDLFGEQTVLCGGLTALMTAGYDTLVEAGYPPEMAYFETIHEVKLIVDLIYEGGIANMRYSVSNTAEYGDFTRGPRVIDPSVKERMKKILTEIQEGDFAREFILEARSGNVSFDARRRRAAGHPMEEVGARLRGLMPWLKENRLVDRSKN